MRVRNIYGALVASTMLFASSCQQDDLMNNTEKVTFSVSLEDGIGTRVGEDEAQTQTMKLYYVIFNQDHDVIFDDNESGKELNDGVRKATINGTGKSDLSVSLTKGQTYYAAFWAQSEFEELSNPYAIELTEGENGARGSMKVRVNYDLMSNNSTKFDAFYGSETGIEPGEVVTVELSRPFAQINAAVPQAELDKAAGHGVDITRSKVEIKGVANTLELFTGDVDGFTNNMNLEYSNSTKEVVTTIENVEYKSLSTNYILVGANHPTCNINFTFATSSQSVAGESIAEKTIQGQFYNVPVNRNWRINIVGNLLSTQTSFQIILDQDFFGPDHIIKDGVVQQ